MIAVDWCCGYGGMTNGMKAAGFEVQGVDKVTDPDAIKKRRVARTTLITGWERLGWSCPPNHTVGEVAAARGLLGPVENSDPSETVSDKRGVAPDGNRPVSDTGVGA